MIKFEKVLVIALSLILSACSDKEMIGPDVNAIHSPLKIEEAFAVDKAVVDFNQGENILFTAKFEYDTHWKLEVISSVNGAKWSIENASKSIGKKGNWNGSTTDLPWFPIGECVATLSFPQHPSVTYQLSFKINSTYNYDKGAVLISDFKTAPISPIEGTTGWPSEWPTTHNFNTQFPKPDGNNYLFMSGHPWQGFPWGPVEFNTKPPFSPFVDILRIDSKAMEGGYGSTLPLFADASRVYFNIMVYNTEKQYTRLQIKFYEINGASRFVDIEPNWKGWKMLSFNYLDLATSSSQPVNTTGVGRIEFLLFKDATGAKLGVPQTAKDDVSIAFDHPVFTFDYALGEIQEKQVYEP